MKFHLYLAALLFAVLGIVGNRAFAQASTVGGQPATIYVDANAGSDATANSITSAGAQVAPLKTIGAAMTQAVQNSARGVSTNVVLNAGVYRESISLPASGQSSAPITIQASSTGSAIVSGSDVLFGWQAISGGEYVHSWQNSLPRCGIPSQWPRLPQITLDNQMVFLNGISLAQIANPGDHRPGTFYVSGSTVHVFPPSGTNMNAATVEVSSRSSILDVNGRSNVTIRGLEFRHAGNCINTSAANVYNSSNILFDRVLFDWNNWGGLGINGSNGVTVQNSVANYNGGIGISSFQNTNLVLKYNETSYNNWRGAMGAFYDFGMGGVKMLDVHGAQLLQHYSFRNQGQGVWFDTDNKNISITDARFSENLLSNLKLEANQGPFTVSNGSFCSGGQGLLISDSANVSVSGSNFYNNSGTHFGAQLYLAGREPGGRPITDWQTHQSMHVTNTNTRLSSNSFQAVGSSQNLFSTYLSGGDWYNFSRSFRSYSNHWLDTSKTAAFMVPGGHAETLSGWQNYTGQDGGSSWSAGDATRSCSVPSPSYSDFQVQANNRILASVGVWSAPYGMSNLVASIPIQVKSFNAGNISLSVSGLPSGVSASFSPSSISNGTTTLTIRASTHARYQTAQVTVFGTGGNRVHSVTFPVEIRP